MHVEENVCELLRKIIKKMLMEKIRLLVSRCYFPTHNAYQRCRHKNANNETKHVEVRAQFIVIASP